MSKSQDPIRDGLKRGWRVLGGAHGALPEKIVCDVAIIGSGAGAGISAELLARAGLQVVMIEEGPLKSSIDFNQREAEAYPAMYQESAGRKTEDKGITVLQGRCVGGTTTVNWTSSFRTPADTLTYWQQKFGLADYTVSAMAPYFEQVERRLGIAPWQVAPNENNSLLQRGAAKLGIPTAVIPRNVRGCADLGSCGMGCPINAKQSMLVTTIPAALDLGATLIVETRAEQFELAKGRIQALRCVAVKPNGAPVESAQAATTVIAKHYILAASAINSPALLLRSKAPDPHQRLGQRTFLHPVVLSAAVMSQRVEAWAGTPQSIYTDHFMGTQPLDGPIGFKLEVPPLHPVIFASAALGYGRQQADILSAFPHTHMLLALLRDGFHEQAAGGQVKLRSDGSAVLDYALTDFVMAGARRALLAMMEIQFAAGARRVLPMHELARPYTSWAEGKQALAALPMKPLLTKVMSAHVMGGCGMAGSESLGVTRPDGVHWQIENLSIHDASIFPTSIGANPQLSIFGSANRLTQGLVTRLTGKQLALA